MSDFSNKVRAHLNLIPINERFNKRDIALFFMCKPQKLNNVFTRMLKNEELVLIDLGKNDKLYYRTKDITLQTRSNNRTYQEIQDSNKAEERAVIKARIDDSYRFIFGGRVDFNAELAK